jgi:hypothetical protein
MGMAVKAIEHAGPPEAEHRQFPSGLFVLIPCELGEAGYVTLQTTARPWIASILPFSAANPGLKA